MTSPQDSEPGRRSRFGTLLGRRSPAENAQDASSIAEPAWVPESPARASKPILPAPMASSIEQPTSEWLPAGAVATIAAEEQPAGPAPGQWLPGAENAGPELSTSRRLAVYAYCHEMCGIDGEATAANQAIGSLRSSRIINDDELLRATRLAAAAHASAAPLGAGWRSRMRDVLAAEHDLNCRRVPMLLARRRNGDLDKNEAAALDEHLEQCLRCQAAEVRLERAERAFAAAVAGTAIEEVESAAAAAIVEPAPASTEKWEAIASAAVPAGAIASAAVPAGASAAVPAGAIATTAAAAATHAVPTAMPPSRRKRGRLGAVPIAIALAVIAVAGAGAAVLLGKSSSSHHSSVSLATPSISSSASTPTIRHHVQHKRVVHHAARKPHRSKPKPTVVASTPSPAPVTTPTTRVVQSTTPVTPAPQPVVPTPTQPTPPPPTTHSVTIQQPSLGPTGGSTGGVGGKKK